MAQNGYDMFRSDCDSQSVRIETENDFDALCLNCYKSLCLYASRYVPAEEAEEIVQDTMMWLWENRDTVAPEKSVKALLFRIVHNKCVNRVKHNAVLSRVHRQIESNMRRHFESPDFYLSRELMQMLDTALEKMPDHLREEFVLSRVEHLSYKEIAERFRGGELWFERLSRFVCRNADRHKSVGKTDARFKWGIDDPTEIERWSPDIRLVDTMYYPDMARSRWGFAGYVMRLIPLLHRSCGVWGYRFM